VLPERGDQLREQRDGLAAPFLDLAEDQAAAAALRILRRVGRIQAVEAEDRVEVDQAAALKLGHLRKRDPNADAVCLGELVCTPAMAMTVRRHS